MRLVGVWRKSLLEELPRRGWRSYVIPASVLG
jgi:hypothetical protein